MTKTSIFLFEDANLLAELARVPDSEIDTFQFGMIGFDADTVVRRYNATESKIASLTVSRVIGHPLFTIVAPCMNNTLVAQRFEDASAAGTELDEVVDYESAECAGTRLQRHRARSEMGD